MTQVTINGNTYSDDGSTAKDMRNGGHRTHFFPLVQDVVTVTGQAQTTADQVSIDAANVAARAAGYVATSATSLTVGAGAQALTVEPGKLFSGGYVIINRTSSPSTYMHGMLTSYDAVTGALVVDVSDFSGSGTHNDWTVSLSAPKGVQGPAGEGVLYRREVAANSTVVATDRATLIDCVAAVTLDFQACAAIGENWTAFVRSPASGDVVLNPSGTELIDGATTFTLKAGHTARIQGDGTQWRVIYSLPTILERLPIGSGIFLAETADTFAAGDGTQYLKTNTWVPASTAMLPLSQTANAAANYAQTKFTESAYKPPFALRAIAYGAGKFVGISSSTLVITSTDGLTWTEHTPTGLTINTPELLRYLNGTFFALGTGGKFCTSTDGIAWTERSMSTDTFGPGSVAWDGAEYLFLNGSSQFCRKTSDFSTWGAEVNVGAGSSPTDVAYGAGLWVVVSVAGAAIRTSPTGATWTTRTPATGTGAFHSVFWDGVRFVAWRANGTYHTSADGITWSAVINSGAGNVSGLHGVATDNAGHWCAMSSTADRGGFHASFSADIDAPAWAKAYLGKSPNSGGVSKCAFGGGKLVVNISTFMACAASDLSGDVQHIYYGTGTNAANPIGALYARYA